MPLYHIQDSDRPMWVVAKDWHDALDQWKAQVASENDGEESEPLGIQHVCNDDQLMINGVYQD